MSSSTPWHAAFPAPKPEYSGDNLPIMSKQRALMVNQMRIASMLIVDVRRTDYEGGAIRGSLNIPAHGFWWNRGILYELAYKADMEWVVFTCGSSNGRGPRCASWFLEHVRETVGNKDMQVMVLEGGVKGWVKAGAQYIQFMDGYREEYWNELLAEEEKQQQKQAEPSGALAEAPSYSTSAASGSIASAAGAGDVTQ